MILVLAICVAVTFGVSAYLMLGRELKGVAMGVFLLGHAANLAILAASGSPRLEAGTGAGGSDFAQAGYKRPPVSDPVFDAALRDGTVADPLTVMVDPVPQALILTAIVIGFAVMGFLLSLLVVTSRNVGTLTLDELAQVREDRPDEDIDAIARRVWSKRKRQPQMEPRLRREAGHPDARDGIDTAETKGGASA
jgi:multisubunit Na+/H+ antiporter MnhC subunit